MNGMKVIINRSPNDKDNTTLIIKHILYHYYYYKKKLKIV